VFREARTPHQTRRGKGVLIHAVTVVRQNLPQGFSNWAKRDKVGHNAVAIFTFDASLERLDEGVSVRGVVLAVGYSSVSAFIDVFRKSYGITRGSYKEHHCAILASKADKRLV
jgi:AraC-like DNA-binding protein